MKTISYTISDEDYRLIQHAAHTKGLKPSEFSRLAIFSYINKYPCKGVFAELDTLITELRIRTP